MTWPSQLGTPEKQLANKDFRNIQVFEITQSTGDSQFGHFIKIVGIISPLKPF